MKVILMPSIRTLLLMSVAGLQACASEPSIIDANFGASLRTALQAQIVHPEPDPKAPARSDGQSAKSAIDRYQRSFDVLPPTTNVFNIGVGNGAGTAP